MMWPWKEGTATIKLDCTSGEPALLEFTVKAKPGSDGIPASVISLEDVNRFIDHAVATDAVEVVYEILEASGSHPVSRDYVNVAPEVEGWPGYEVVENDTVGETRERAVTASRKSRNRGGRPRTPDEKKLDVLDAYEKEGIEEAKKVAGAEERWTRELIKQAKELRNQSKGGH